MESPFRAWGNMGTRGSISTILSRFIWERVCALTNPPIYLTQHLLIDLKLIVTNSEKFLCWILHTLIMSTLSCAVSGHFSWLADSLALCRGRSAVQNSKSTGEIVICVSQPKSPMDGTVFNPGQSAVVPKFVPKPSQKLVDPPIWPADSPLVLRGWSAVDSPSFTQNQPNT